MASLKEIRNRIKSVSSTRKITSAMKMVSAAKLKKAQRTIENSLPYVSKISTILNSFVASLDSGVLPAISQVREVRRVAIIAVSSNSSLCGAFNSNAIKAFTALYNDYRKRISAENIIVFPIGKKITEAADKLGIAISEDNIDIGHSVEYATVDSLMTRLMQDFAEKRIDKVEVVYNHFKSAASQAVRTETLLPFAPPQTDNKQEFNADYIIEPSAAELVSELIPKVAKLQLFTALQDSVAAEHAARTMAMQIATDNADDLSQELKLSYNKMRQASITNEIITITGGAEALK
jgi:F-type H+-transporting ATPase subunit gamma